MRYRIASMMPQARLHPSAPISIARTSSRPASATLSDPVKLRTMISPNSTSATRSTGSSTPLESACVPPDIDAVNMLQAPFRLADASLRPRRQQIQGHSEHREHHQQEHPEEPR